MPSLKLLLNGKDIAELELNPKVEHSLGRDQECDLVLPAHPGISRRHCRVWLEKGNWNIEVLSQYGGLFLSGEELKTVILKPDEVYKLGPFQLMFESIPTVTVTQSVNRKSQLIDDEKTFVGDIVLSPELLLKDHAGKLVKKFKLVGGNWSAGRDIICDVQIEDLKISRRQFEIKRNKGGYVIRDLESVNGTLLNGKKLAPHPWTPLMSGDKIKVGSWTVCFELRDSKYNQKLQGLRNAPAVYEASDTGPLGLNGNGEEVDGAERPEMLVTAAVKKKNLVRYATMVLAMVGILGFFLSEDAPAPTQPQIERTPATKMNVAFEKLSPDQQQFVRQTHKLAKELFMQGRYEMARQEIMKISQFVDSYEDSKDIEAAAFQAVQIQQEKSRIEAQEKEKMEIEEKIQKQLQICRKAITNPAITMDSLDNCLAPIIQFDPEHSGIQDLKRRVDEVVTARTMKQAAADDWRAKLNKHIAIFNRAKAQANRGDSLGALKTYRIVYNSPVVSNTEWKEKSKNEIDTLQREIDEKQKRYTEESEAAVKMGRLKDAIVALSKALVFNPEDEVMKGKINSILTELRKQMQTTYQEGILEESVGEVETAKAKWKKILETSVPQEEYYKKALIKLKKYGAI